MRGTRGSDSRTGQDIPGVLPGEVSPEGRGHAEQSQPTTAVSAKADSVEKVIAPAAIERALSIYQQIQERDRSVVAQVRKILTQHIYGMVDRGERDEQRLVMGGLAQLRAIERDHDIKPA